MRETVIRVDCVAKSGDRVATKTIYTSTPLDAAYMLRLISLAQNLDVSAQGGPIAECEQLDALLGLLR